MDTLLLDQTRWDLILDTSGNIALASAPYALAQDAASAIRLFAGEAYYDTAQGVPYFSEILGHPLNAGVVKAALTKAALTVPGVVSAQVFLSSLTHRELTGQVQVTDTAGVLTASNF